MAFIPPTVRIILGIFALMAIILFIVAAGLLWANGGNNPRSNKGFSYIRGGLVALIFVLFLPLVVGLALKLIAWSENYVTRLATRVILGP